MLRVIERGEQLGFALESRETVGVAARRLGQDLDGDVATEPRVSGAIDLAHPAGTERCDDFVGAESISRGKGHGLGSLL